MFSCMLFLSLFTKIMAKKVTDHKVAVLNYKKAKTIGL